MIRNITISGLLLAVILILFACDDPIKLGLDLQREDQRISAFFTDTFTIESSVKLFDTINTTINDASGRAIVGSLNDKNFGKITSSVFGSFLVPTNGLSFTDAQNPTVLADSANIALYLFISSSYGDTSKSVTINVHQITEALSSKKFNYHSRDKFPVGRLLGRTQTKIKAGTTIEIRLNQNLAKEIIEKNNTETLKTQENFEQFFKGLRISMEGAENFIFTFDPNDRNNSTRMTITFKNTASDASPKVRNLFFSGLNGVGIIFSSMQYDFSQTPHLKNLRVNNSIPTTRIANQCYVMGGVGIATLIRFPSLYGFSKDKNIIVNRAELVIEPSEQNFQSLLANQTLPNLRFIVANKEGLFDRYPSTTIPRFLLFETATGFNSQSILTMPYISAGRSYQPVIITSYVQALMNKTIEDTGLFVIPERLLSSIDYACFGDSKAPNKMKLLVYYTVITR